MKILDKRMLLAWVLGIPISYFWVGYLENFYPALPEIAFGTLILHGGVGMINYFLLGKISNINPARLLDALIYAIAFIALVVLVPVVYFIAKPYPNIFDLKAFQLPDSSWSVFSLALISALHLSLWLLSLARRGQWKESRLFHFIDENWEGLLAAFLFFAVYLIFASIFNRPSYDADDIFFDADGNLYRWRFATENYRDYYWRPAHPFILIIVRPLVGVLTLLFNGDALFAGFTLNALVGGLCVFLVWYFVKNAIGIRIYALLIAILFGASSTQLVFGSIMESYIFLSAIALIFLVLLQKDKPLPALVIAGLITFGITISNVGQTFIAHFFVKRNLRQIIIYGLIVGALVVPLSLLNNYIYPNSQPYFWDISTLEGEGHNQFPPTLQRAHFLVRVMALHSFVAPEPLVIRDGFPFPKTWMFRAAIKKEPMQIATYETLLGNGLAFTWAGLLVLGGVFFLKNFFKQDNRYFFTFIFTVLFFFALHMQYGKDAFLYAANWTYAIMLFMALAWRDLAGKSWFQVLLLVFILLLIVNNTQLYQTMLENSAPTVTISVWR